MSRTLTNRTDKTLGMVYYEQRFSLEPGESKEVSQDFYLKFIAIFPSTAETAVLVAKPEPISSTPVQSIPEEDMLGALPQEVLEQEEEPEILEDRPKPQPRRRGR
jgi:hypothetical protein